MQKAIKPAIPATAIVKQPEQGSPLTLISQAIENKVDVETMEKLMALQGRWEKNQAQKAFNIAMAKFQMECPTIAKTKKVFEKGSKTEVRYSYASLDSIIAQVKKPLGDNELSYSFDEEKDEKFTNIICIVTHILGHSQRTGFKIPIGTEAYMSDVQKYGARMTFGKRYAFCNALGILTGDEDTDAVNTEASDEEKSKQGFKTLMGALQDSSLKQIADWQEKIAKSNKYTPEQKTEFGQAAKARIKELSKPRKPIEDQDIPVINE